MLGHANWNYRPYSRVTEPWRRINPFICRLEPHAQHLCFEWLDPERESAGLNQACPAAPAVQYTAYWRIWGSGSAYQSQLLNPASPDVLIRGLETGRDYELYIERQPEGRTSPIRRFRTGEAVGQIVNYLHPEDPVYSFSGHSLCSPSLLKLPSGRLLASMDVFAGGRPQNLTLLFASDDQGQSWHYLTELLPCFWGKLFYHRGRTYMLAHSTEYGHLLIGCSEDEGRTWSAPVLILPGAGSQDQGPHKAPMPVIEYQGRLFTAIDYGSWGTGGFKHALLSIDAASDLMEASNWTCSDFLAYDPVWPGACKGVCMGGLEGNAVVGPDGEIYNVLRYQMAGSQPAYGRAMVLRGSWRQPEAKLQFAWFADFNGGSNSKFDLLYDQPSQAYWAIVSEVVEPEHPAQRNVLSLACSRDLKHFEIVRRLLDFRQEDPACVGFQYVSFLIDGNDMLYLCRTSLNHARNMHDANYSTFHRISDFRQYLPVSVHPDQHSAQPDLND
ncbi:MAG: sialidase family protein [Oscillospiraceae bacterium]|nr:sialidase family protein [Oscillospiraceae bacterium]